MTMVYYRANSTVKWSRLG